MSTRTIATALALSVVLAAGCTTGRSRPAREAKMSDLSPIYSGSATIFPAEMLHRANRSLLDVLEQHVANIQVINSTPCPEVYLRGKSNLTTPSDPAIYVNQTRAANTCILSALETFDLQRVEVYPSGLPKNGQYLANPYGVIVITLVTMDQ